MDMDYHTFCVDGSKISLATSDKDNDCMKWSMLREMAESGHEIINHGWVHLKVWRLNQEAMTDLNQPLSLYMLDQVLTYRDSLWICKFEDLSSYQALRENTTLREVTGKNDLLKKLK